MNKLSLFLTSLVAAIPGGILAALMVMTIVSKFSEMSTAFTVLAGIVLAVCAFVTVLPLGILIFGPKREKPDDHASEEMIESDEFEEDEMDGDEFGDDEFATAEVESVEFEEVDEFEEWDEEE